MSIEVKFYSLFRINLKSTGITYDIENSITLDELIKRLDDDFDGYFSKKLIESGDIRTGSIILLNGKNILHLDKLNTEITNEDIVTLFPPSAGG